MGYKYVEGQPPTRSSTASTVLMPINLSTSGLAAQASTKGGMGANLPANAAVGDSYKTSLSAFDSQGTSHLLDFTTPRPPANAWSVNVVDRDSGTSIGTKNLTFAADGSSPPCRRLSTRRR